MKSVFVVAMPNEAAAVRAALGDSVPMIVSGIGKVNAAMATERAIVAMGADAICNCGLCGGMDAAMRVGELYEVSRAVEFDFDLDELNHRGIGVLDEREDAYLELTVKGIHPARILATSDHFRSDDGDYPLIDRLGCGLRDMEGAAIAHVCSRHGVRCHSLKVVCDVRGQGPMVEQYFDTSAKCLAALSAALPRWYNA